MTSKSWLSLVSCKPCATNVTRKMITFSTSSLESERFWTKNGRLDIQRIRVVVVNKQLARCPYIFEAKKQQKFRLFSPKVARWRVWADKTSIGRVLIYAFGERQNAASSRTLCTGWSPGEGRRLFSLFNHHAPSVTEMCATEYTVQRDFSIFKKLRKSGWKVRMIDADIHTVIQ